MIVNMNGGDDEKYNSRVDTAIHQARSKGMYVLGYTYTSYGQRDPKIVRKKIDAVLSNYVLDGIFVDEAPTSCTGANPHAVTNYRYYRDLSNYIRMKHTGANITVLNPGTYSPNDCWMADWSILMNWENIGLSTYQSAYVEYPWVKKYPADRFWHVLLGVPQADLPAALELAKSRNAGWVYISESPDNAYNQVPSYWAAEAAAVSQQGVHSPYATAFPDSSDGGNGIVKGRVSIRWRAMNGAVWQTFLDTDQSAGTGYRDTQLAVGAEYMLEASHLGVAKLYRYTGSGFDWSWSEVPAAEADVTFSDPNTNYIGLNTSALNGAARLDFQIRSLDASYNRLYTSYRIPLELNNTGFVQDIASHLP